MHVCAKRKRDMRSCLYSAKALIVRACLKKRNKSVSHDAQLKALESRPYVMKWNPGNA